MSGYHFKLGLHGREVTLKVIKCSFTYLPVKTSHTCSEEKASFFPESFAICSILRESCYYIRIRIFCYLICLRQKNESN